MTFFDELVRRPVAMCMVVLATLVFGVVSYLRLPLTLMPDLSYPTLTVRTEVPGAAPEEVEGLISRPIEEALSTTEGMVGIESRSRAGLSDVVLEFGWGTDMDQAAQAVRERLQTTFLPGEAERPLLLRYDPSLEPILRISLAFAPEATGLPRGDEGMLMLRELADKEVKRRLEALDGVAAVRVRGGLERQVLVEAREDWLVARGVTLAQLSAALDAGNVNVPGGSIYEGDKEVLVRTLGEVRSLDEIRALPIRRGDGLVVRVDEVASVREGFKDREVMSRLDGEDAVDLEVFKAADANVVRVAQQIRSALGEDGGGIKGDLPEGVVLTVRDSQAGFIEEALANLRGNLFQGALLSVVVLFLFLRDLRATAVATFSIPLCIIFTFGPMYLGGVSLNLLSLGGLALGVGMVMDNAVVVLEAIQTRRDAGQGRIEAAIDGAREVASPVIAGTLTTICVFLPMAFVEGVAGQIFGDLALTIVFSLVASLFLAIFVVPVVAAIDFGALPAAPTLRGVSDSARFPAVGELRAAWRGQSGWRRLVRLPWWILRFVLVLPLELGLAIFSVLTALVWRLVFLIVGGVLLPTWRVADRVAERFLARYERFADAYDGRLRGALRRPGALLGGAALAVLVTAALLPQLGRGLLPEMHQGRFTVDLALPVGTPLGRTATAVEPVEAALRALPGIASVHAVIGAERRADSRPDEGEHTARLTVTLDEGGGLAAREDAAMVAAREAAEAALATQDLPSTVRLGRPELFSFQSPLEVILYDNDLETLRAASRETLAAMSRIEGLADVSSSLVDGYPEVRIRYDRQQLARFGLDTASVAAAVRDKVQGSTATTLSRGTGRVDLIVRLTEDDRRATEDLRRLNVNPALNPPIPLEAVAQLDEGEGPSEIRRVDQQRAAVLTAGIEGLSLSGPALALSAALGDLDLGGADWEIAGQNEEMQRSLRSLGFALALAVFLVYAVMAVTFESVLHPLAILVSVPLSVVGIVPALWLTGTPVSVVVLLGAIVLTGVVVSNAIVLVDAINTLRAEGRSAIEAVAQAGRLRLRPILNNTLTTVLGLVPLALGLGEGAEVQRPLALTIMAGLTASTVLTLGVIPVLYTRLVREKPDAPPPTDEGPRDES